MESYKRSDFKPAKATENFSEDHLRKAIRWFDQQLSQMKTTSPRAAIYETALKSMRVSLFHMENNSGVDKSPRADTLDTP